MSDAEKPKSKYALKQAAKAAGTWQPPEQGSVPERDPPLDNHFRCGAG